MSPQRVIAGLIVLFASCNGSPLIDLPLSTTTENEIGVSNLMSGETTEKPRLASGSGLRDQLQPTLKTVNRAEVVPSGATTSHATTPSPLEHTTRMGSVQGQTTRKGSVVQQTTHKGSVVQQTTHKGSVPQQTTRKSSALQQTTHKTPAVTHQPVQEFNVKSSKNCAHHQKDHVVRIHFGTGRYLNINLSD